MTGKPKDLTGLKFGKLTVINLIKLVPSQKESYRSAYWNTLCDCGNYKKVFANNLVGGTVASCGCLRGAYKRPNTEKTQEAIKRRLWRKYADNARKRNYTFNVSYEDFSKLLIQDCFYCGAKPTQRPRTDHKQTAFLYNGIDRVHNTQGYETNNIVTCCGICNTIKWDLSLEAFKDKITLIYKNFILNNHGKT